ncbi:MAG: 5-(carboxyamino)imidazole ribonucleotide synthase [Saprospiraceae bacterium]|nr:5-(carboxyamino)imidazole ribonucleotide synthase [Saprospiraceae bacterium]
MSNRKKLGILGGGQLGKMLSMAAGPWHYPIHMLDESSTFPAGPYSMGFTEGSFKDYEAVLAFGRQMDVVSIEIEHVNTEALEQLESEGIVVHPAPRALKIIKDKGLQKQFYTEHQIPTSGYQLFDTEEALRDAIKKGELAFPFVQKSRTAGYDGKGVALIKDASDLAKLLPGPSLIEELVDIEKELSIVAARNEQGQIATFPLVEMEFNEEANLVEFLLCPARVAPEVETEADQLARKVIEAFDICGLLAVELFWTKGGEILVNEVAPRPHNSGHHTIESCLTSQFQQHLRGVLSLPWGRTKATSPAVMLNLLGEPGHTGPAHYQGFEDCLAIDGVYIHLYGKAITKPYRKMGHITVLGANAEEAIAKAMKVKGLLKVISRSS